MTTTEPNYQKALALQKEIHGTYIVPDWILDFLHDASRDSVQIQHRSSHDEQVANMTKLCSWMVDIGYGLGKTQIMQTVMHGQAGLAAIVFSMLTSCLKTLDADEIKRITKEILAIQKDVGVKEFPEEKYVKWALSVLSPSIAALVVGNVEEYAKTIGSVLVAFYVLGRYDETSEVVPEVFNFDGLDKILKGLGE